MAPRIRLKTKLVLAISGMVMALVVGFCSIYVRQSVHQGVQDTYENGDFVAHQIFFATHEALEIDLNSTQVDAGNPQSVRGATEEILQTDPGLNSLMQSIVASSRPIYATTTPHPHRPALPHTHPPSPFNPTPPPPPQTFL